MNNRWNDDDKIEKRLKDAARHIFEHDRDARLASLLHQASQVIEEYRKSDRVIEENRRRWEETQYPGS